MNDAIRILEEADVRSVLARVDTLAVMRSLFAALGRGRAVQPAQTLTMFPADAGDFITYLGVLAEAKVFGAKLSPYIVRPQGALITAWTMLMSMESGRPLLLCDSKALTTERTAATTALAVDFLAPAEATKLAVIGAGAIGRAHVRHIAPLRKWKEIRAYSRNLGSNADAQAAIKSVDARVSIVRDLPAAVDDVDAVLLCTSSGTSVLDPRILKKPTLITSISTNVAQAHEVPPDALLSMDVYCDYRGATPGSAGEMVLAAKQEWSPDLIAGDLAELATGASSAPKYDRHVFFRSIGLGLEDVAMANALR